MVFLCQHISMVNLTDENHFACGNYNSHSLTSVLKQYASHKILSVTRVGTV